MESKSSVVRSLRASLSWCRQRTVFLNRNTNVDLFFRNFKVSVCSGKIKQFEIRISNKRSHTGRHICNDRITFSCAQRNQHRRSGFLSRQLIYIWNLRNTCIIPNCIQLGSTCSSIQISNALRICIRAVCLYQGNDRSIVIRRCEVNTLKSVRCDGLACDNAVYSAGLYGRYQENPSQVLQFQAQGQAFQPHVLPS